MKSIILARVSTEEQKEAGNSLPAQTERLRKYVLKTKELEEWEEFSFDESAYTSETRKEFQEIIKIIKESSEPVALCCDKVDRLARNFLTEMPKLEELRKSGDVYLHFPSDHLVLDKDSSAQELFQFNIAVSLAQYYSDAISDNTKRAFEKKRRNGEWHGQAPFGYSNVESDDGSRKDIIPDPDTAPVVVEMYQKYTTGDYSYKKLAEELNERNIKTVRGNEFRTSSVAHIMQDPFYYGVANSNKYGEYPHKYKPILSKKLWEDVEKVREGKNNNPVKTYGKYEYIFQGLVKCKKCGCAMSPEMKKGEYVYYSCTGAKGDCENAHKYVNQDQLLETVKEDLARISLTEEQIDDIVSFLKDHHEKQSLHHKQKVKKLQDEYNEIEEKLDKLLDLHIESSITQDVYDKKHKKLKERQQIINIELEELTQADDNYHITAKTVLSIAKRSEEIFESSEPREKRQFVKFLLQNSTIDDKKLEYKLQEPFKTLVDVGEQPNGLRRLDSNQ